MGDSHFYLGDLYPNFYPATTRRQTIPEESEQELYEAAKGKAPEVMPGAVRLNVWFGIAALLVLMFFLSV